MVVTGIIAEYNPFHTGHAYHLARCRELTGADYVIVVLSGSFTQRGEPAIADKWTRTAAALENGADLVLELPVPYATASAEGFAAAGVTLLTAAGADFLGFGAETADLSVLEAALPVLQSPAFSARLKAGLAEGLSFAAARGRALAALTCLPETVFAAPNNILALEYLRAIQNQTSPLRPVVVPRQGGYHEKALPAESSYPSATALRRALEKAPRADLSAWLPGKAIAQAREDGLAPVFAESLAPLLHYRLRTASPAELAAADGMGEGIENRILAALDHCTGWGDLCRAVQNKRFPAARVRRCLCHILLQTAPPRFPVPYLRVLGFRRAAKPLLTAVCAHSPLPVLTNPGRQIKYLPPAAAMLFAQEVRTTDIYMLLTPDPKWRAPGQDFTHPLVLL